MDRRTVRGDATIRTLLLGELAEDVRIHATTVLLPSVEEVTTHLAAQRLIEARARWDQLLRDTLAPDAPLSAFSFQALHHLMPPAFRQDAGLQAPERPGAR